jgi:hypothetical protein
MATFDPSSREAEAQAELAATRQGRGIAAALAAGLLTLLASGPAVELLALAAGDSALFAPLPPAGDERAGLRGALARARERIDELEARFDERSLLVRSLRPHTQALLTRGLRYGNEQALVGREGWLFFRDDVEHLVAARPAASFAGDPEREILAFRDALAARGVALLLLPTPLKPTVHPEMLATGARAPIRRPGEREQLARFAERGVEILDLADRFARDAPIAPLYLATDTHWRPEGVEIAAQEVALRLRMLVELPPGESDGWREEPRRIAGRGDSATLLGLPPRSALYVREEVETRAVEVPPATRAPVLLLGDSFAGIYGIPELGWGAGAGLADRLAFALGLPVDRLLQNAGGASATRDLLARDPARLAGVRAVVWQFAARELSQGDWRPVALPPDPTRADRAGGDR